MAPDTSINQKNLDIKLEFYRSTFRSVARYEIVMSYKWKHMGIHMDGLEFEDAMVEAERLTYEFRDDGSEGAWGNMLCTPRLLNSEEAKAHLRQQVAKRGQVANE